MAGSIRPLPLWCVPRPDESLLGHLLRLAHRLRYPTAAPILTKAGVSNIVESHPFDWSAVQRIAATVPVQRAGIEALAYASSDQRCQFWGHPLHRDLITTSWRRVCPLCLQGDGADPYHRAIWDLTLLTVCPVHGCGLIDICQSCGKQIGWRTSAPFRCQCSSDLRTQTPSTASPAGRAVAQRIASMFGTAPDALEGLAAEIGLSEFLRLAMLIGRTECGGKLHKAPSFAKLHRDQLPDALSTGWSVCDGWPTAFHSWLDRLREKAGERNGRFGLHKAFGSLPVSLGAVRDAPHAIIAQAEMDAYIAGRPELPTRRPAVKQLRQKGGGTVHLNLSQAARQLGVGTKSLRNLALAEGWIQGGGAGAPLLFDDKLMVMLKQQMADLIDQAEACALLGIQKRLFHKLWEEGLLPAPCDSGLGKLGMKPAWSRSGLQTWLSDLSTARSEPRGALVHLVSAGKRLGVIEQGSESIVRAVLGGAISVAGIDPAQCGLKRLLFNDGDVEALRRTLNPSETYSIPQVAVMLRVPQYAAYDWADKGFLVSKIGPGTRVELGTRISPDDLERFRSEYVTAAELRQRGLGQTNGALLMSMMTHVHPVSGPSVDGTRQYLFRRAEVEEFLSCNPTKETKQ